MILSSLGLLVVVECCCGLAGGQRESAVTTACMDVCHGNSHFTASEMVVLAMQAGLGPRLSSSLGGLLSLSPSLLGCLRTLNTVATDIDQSQEHDKRYVDRFKLTVRAGKGGNGCASFYQGASRGASDKLNRIRHGMDCERWVGGKWQQRRQLGCAACWLDASSSQPTPCLAGKHAVADGGSGGAGGNVVVRAVSK